MFRAGGNQPRGFVRQVSVHRWKVEAAVSIFTTGAICHLHTSCQAKVSIQAAAETIGLVWHQLHAASSLHKVMSL